MDIYAALAEVRRWCAEQTAAGDPARLEIEADLAVWITISECSPPWDIRWERRSTAGIGSPLAQLRYHLESGEWALHHGGPPGQGWCSDKDALRARGVAPLLEAITGDSTTRFRRLPRDLWLD